MLRDPFVSFASLGRMHLSLRTLAANDNAPLAATEPPRHADGDASTRWPILNRPRVIAAALGIAAHGVADANENDGARRKTGART